MNNPKLSPDPNARAKEITLELLSKLQAYEGLKSADLWQLHEKHAPKDKFQDERALLNELIELFLTSNNGMISPRLIIDRILYMVIGAILDYPAHGSELLSELESHIKKLLVYHATRSIDIPIVNLDLEGKPFMFGPVSFSLVTDDDRTGMWWDSIQGALGSETAFQCVISYGRVSAPGDLDTSISYVGPVVNDALLLLRGISFPFTVDEVVQFGVIGDVAVNRTRYYRLGDPKENVQLEPHSKWVARLGPPLAPYRLYKDLLSTVDETDLTNLMYVIETEGFDPKATMAAKIMRGLRWLGEASKPDIISARFAKLTFALENLIGGEPRDQQLTSIGLTAMLAERAAFLSSKTPEERIVVDKAVREFYGKRSDIVHGRAVEINAEEINGFAHLVRGIVGTLLRKLDTIKSIDDLQNWVREQRYS